MVRGRVGYGRLMPKHALECSRLSLAQTLLDKPSPDLPSFGKWPEALWKQRKLTNQQYEAYLYLTRDGVLARRQNPDAVREHQAAAAEEEAMQANTRENPALYQAFAAVRAAREWLATFREDRLRYPLLVVMGRSFTGKTEWVKSLFHNPSWNSK